MKNTTKKISRSHGFTLIELMVTIAIVSVLAAIAIPAYNGYIKTAKMAEAKTNLSALRLAEEEYFIENNTYFFGNSTASLESESEGLWKATDDTNFDYVVTASSGWTAVATGNVSGTSTYNEEVIFTKQ